jgi:hypothetical protein
MRGRVRSTSWSSRVNGRIWSRTSSGSGDGVGAQHIGRLFKAVANWGVAGFGMLSEGDEDEGFDGQSGDGVSCRGVEG